MALGPWGELIPNENITVEIEGERFINIPNPTRIACNAILSAISYLCEMKREKWSISLIDLNEIRVRCMQMWCCIFFSNYGCYS